MTVPDGAPKHIEWADRMAHSLQIAISYVGLIQQNERQGRIKLGYLGSLQESLSDLDKVRDEIINSENLEEELHDLCQAVQDWGFSKMPPASLIGHDQSAQRVLDRRGHKSIPCDGDVYQRIGEPLGNCGLRGYHRGECKLGPLETSGG